MNQAYNDKKIATTRTTGKSAQRIDVLEDGTLEALFGNVTPQEMVECQQYLNQLNQQTTSSHWL